MNRFSRQPAPNCHRLTSGVRIVQQEESGLAICNYPLRVVRLSANAIRLLSLCSEERTCEELTHFLNMPIKRVRTLCEQLRWKGLLEAGPLLPPAIWPSVSIIIPSHNRASQLERCLRTLFDLDYPVHCLEIIVVDDASTDETSVMLQQLLQESAVQGTGREIYVVRHTSQRGVAKSRNTGAEAAHYDVLAYIDSDCIASQSWLTELVPVLQDDGMAAVGGMIRAYERNSMLGRYEDVRSSLFMGIRPQKVCIEGPLTYLPTANMLVRRDVWQKLGGFAPLTFGEDVDFCCRLLLSGCQIMYVPQGVVYHDYRTRLQDFLSIRASYASAEAALLQRHPEERRVLVLPPEQATFAGLVVGGVWGIIWEILRLAPTGGALSGTRKGCHYTSRQSRRVVASLAGARRRISQISFLIALILTLFGVRTRFQKVQKQRIPLGPFTVLQATLRGHLAYTYHLCRHLTRYYTFPLLTIGLLLPPLLLFWFILCSIVIGVDYVRLRPNMSVGQYALCSVLDDCAYEVGVVRGCMRHRTWKPLVPIVKKSNR